MKKLLLVLLCLPLLTLAQQTYVPDDTFEQWLINFGYDNVLDDSVTTANIETIITMAIHGLNIADLTGIQDFRDLTTLFCGFNQLTSLDVSNNLFLSKLFCYENPLTSLDVSGAISLTHLQCFNTNLTFLDVSQNTALTYLLCHNNQLISLDVNGATALTQLWCAYNQLPSLDVSQNINLTVLTCADNQLTSIDVSHNTNLDSLYCSSNQLTSLDVSHNIALTLLKCGVNQLPNLDVSQNTTLTYLHCQDNQLTSLDLRNGNNINIQGIKTLQNLSLTCIDVDDSSFSSNNWINAPPFVFQFDSLHYFSNNCTGTSIEEHATNKELLRTIDVLGRETKGKKNEPLFYIYDDGTVEKRITIE